MDIRELIGEATEYDKKVALEEKRPRAYQNAYNYSEDKNLSFYLQEWNLP